MARKPRASLEKARKREIPSEITPAGISALPAGIHGRARVRASASASASASARKRRVLELVSRGAGRSRRDVIAAARSAGERAAAVASKSR